MDNQKLKQIASEALNIDLSDVAIVDSEAVWAEVKDGTRTAGGASVSQKMRALMLLAQNDGKEAVRITQTKHFKHLGAMLDMSRGGVMRPEKVKEFLVKLALYGADYMMLYTEDIFTLEGYPYFGYLRGAYTDEELRDIDDFAAALDIEIIPCIQTLGHLAQYLVWEESRPIRDTASVLLADEEKTYEFIDCVIAKMRSVFRSKRIHIGMDEAHDVGLGEYLRRHGYQDRFSVLNRHLARVKAICDKYGFDPMMWSDMFFRIGTGDYYKYDTDFPAEVVEQIPDVDMVYWDYYHDSEDVYRGMIRRHRQMKRPIIFSGSVWTCMGFLPDTFNFVMKNSIPALNVCVEERIENVMATFWGDGGCEMDYFYGLYGFAAFAEFCYRGKDATMAEIEAAGELVSGYPTELLRHLDAFHGEADTMIGKCLVYGDVFYNVTGYDWSTYPVLDSLRTAAEAIGEEYRYEKLLLSIAYHKAKLYASLQADYKAGKDLSVYVTDILPELKREYEEFFRVYQEQWLKLNKVFGFEVLSARFGGCILRLQYAMDTVRDYCEGKRDRIEELEYTPVYGECRTTVFYENLAFGRVPSYN